MDLLSSYRIFGIAEKVGAFVVEDVFEARPAKGRGMQSLFRIASENSGYQHLVDGEAVITIEIVLGVPQQLI